MEKTYIITESELYTLISRAMIAAIKEDWQTPNEFLKANLSHLKEAHQRTDKP
jgi:hypothetical protein